MAGADTYNEANAEMEKIFQFVAKRVARDWKWLGRELKIDNCVIEGIEEDYKCTQEKAFQVLVRWSQENGKAGATNEVLIKALQAIGKTSIAEEIHGFCAHKSLHNQRQHGHGNVSQIDKQPFDTSHPTPSSPSHTTNGYNQAFQKIDKELDGMLKYCQHNLIFCDCPALGHILKVVEHVQVLNEIIMTSTHSHERCDDDEPETAETKKARRTRCEQTDQTNRLIHKLLTDASQQASRDKKTRTNRTRPVSEILQRCTSEVILQPRSDTFSSGLRRDSISSPISTSRQCLVSRAESREPSPTMHDRICEEELNNTETAELPEPPQLIQRCQSCGSCLNFEVERHASENKEISLDENCNQASKPDPISDETDADGVEDGSNDSKL